MEEVLFAVTFLTCLFRFRGVIVVLVTLVVFLFGYFGKETSFCGVVGLVMDKDGLLFCVVSHFTFASLLACIWIYENCFVGLYLAYLLLCYTPYKNVFIYVVVVYVVSDSISRCDHVDTMNMCVW